MGPPVAGGSVTAGSEEEAVGDGQTQRLAPEQRKALLVAAAEEIFASRSYTQAGLAEVASVAGVSKTLLYHYFPGGRPELYCEVMDRLADEVVDTVKSAVHAPVAPSRRLADLVASLLTYFGTHPDVYRLLFLEPWGSGDPTVVGKATAVLARLSAEIDALLAHAGQPLGVTVAGGAAALGAVLALSELAIGGELSGEQATDAAQRFVHAGLAALDLV